jgi:hypothetical protein
MFDQYVWVVPSLDMVIVRTGFFGPSNWSHEFFRILMRGVRDAHVPDPGPLPEEPIADLSEWGSPSTSRPGRGCSSAVEARRDRGGALRRPLDRAGRPPGAGAVRRHFSRSISHTMWRSFLWLEQSLGRLGQTAYDR